MQAVNNDVKQVIEVRPEESKMHRLLQLLGVWYEKGHCLVFVDKQDTCDEMFSVRPRPRPRPHHAQPCGCLLWHFSSLLLFVHAAAALWHCGGVAVRC